MPDKPSSGPELPEAPEWARALAWLHHHARQNWDLFVKPPVLAALLLVAVSAYYYGKSIQTEQLEIAGERISFLGDQLSAYRDRLKGATPDEAAGQIASLRQKLNDAERKLDVLMPDVSRELHGWQIHRLESRRADLKKYVKYLNVYASTVGDSASYALKILDTLKKIGVPAYGLILAPCIGNDSGVMVGLIDPKKPSEGARHFFEVLKYAGLSPHFTEWNSDASHPNTDFDLFVCNAPVTSPPAAPPPSPSPRVSPPEK